MNASFVFPSRAPVWGLRLLRLSLGVMWISHALLKLLVFTLPGTAAFFVSVGLPGALAWPVFAAELAGGLALLAGWRARWVSLALLPILAGATAVHASHGWVFTAPGGGWEYPAFLLAMSVVHVLLDDGRPPIAPRREREVAA